MHARQVRAVALAGVIAALAFASPSEAASAGSGPYDVWHRVFLAGLPHDNYLVSVEATSAKDMWAVGGNIDNVQPYGYAIHWHRNHWHLVSFPDPTFSPSIVSASSPANVWISGQTHPTPAREAYRWDGSRWHLIPMPEETGSIGLDLVVLGPSDVWADGHAGPGARTGAWHWDGSQWNRSTLPVSGAYPGAILGWPHHGLWAIGTRFQYLSVYLWTGRTWRRMPVPRIKLRYAPQAAMARSSGDLWITGKTVRGTRILLHRHDGQWRRIDTSWLVGTDVGQPGPDALKGFWLGEHDYWTGRSWTSADFAKGMCLSTISTGLDSFAAIPGTRSELLAEGCVGRRIEGGVFQTFPS
jgi:hypothetical protein